MTTSHNNPKYLPANRYCIFYRHQLGESIAMGIMKTDGKGGDIVWEEGTFTLSLEFALRNNPWTLDKDLLNQKTTYYLISESKD